ncbi:ATP-binding protein [Streptomyces sp. H10-C2]|uniref:ATP-binding protein n=1 Tax=unclassified Streptomyces TaxID=2593676 RepID=UPI0024B9DDD0|nr:MULTISPECIES: ATP-binding protein [unclassified Streptomyces]MDJ0344284.1 ATP-binding protein [Streptomyces sp. PH10-H1]MDJ0373653.1 ATP-binding protein [Streptomyces sp. H10-C2]
MEVCGSVPPDPATAAPPGDPAAPFAPRPYEGVWRFTAPAVDSSVPQVRHGVRDLVTAKKVPLGDDLLAGILLIVSELVTNAVRHAALLSPLITIEVAVGADWIRIGVEDNHPYRPKALEAEYGDTGGRGLLLVKAITTEAGGMCDVTHTETGGKVIWAALPLPGAAL